MNGKVRGLALELLRRDCVESLDRASTSNSSEETKQQAQKACELYDKALHGAAKDDN